jgi:hypothetical protein
MPAEAVYRHKNMVDGNPRKIPRMGTLSGIGHPSSVALPSRQPDRPHSETGTGEPQRQLRVDASFHQIWGPFWKGTGVFWQPGGRPAWMRAPRSGGSHRVMPEIHSPVKSLITPRKQDEGSRYVVPLRRWVRLTGGEEC